MQSRLAEGVVIQSGHPYFCKRTGDFGMSLQQVDARFATTWKSMTSKEMLISPANATTGKRTTSQMTTYSPIIKQGIVQDITDFVPAKDNHDDEPC